MCCHTEIKIADQTRCLTLSQCTDIGPTRPGTDPIASDIVHGSCENVIVLSECYDYIRSKPGLPTL